MMIRVKHPAPEEVDDLTVVRQALIDWRDRTLATPQNFEEAVLLSHAIAWLSWAQELREKWVDT